MPRARKTQPAQAPGDQAYGAAGAQIAAQQQMPLPDVRSAPAPAAAGSAPAPAAAGAAPDPLAAALAMAPPEPPPWAAGPMDEQITAGLPIGPGPGPEALSMGRPPRIGVAEMMRRVAEVTGNPYYAELAQDVESYG